MVASIVDDDDEDVEICGEKSSAPAMAPTARGPVSCVLCGSEHERRMSVLLAACGHHAGKQCLEVLLSGTTSLSTDAAAQCTCKAPIGLLDVLSATGAENAATLGAAMLHSHVAPWEGSTRFPTGTVSQTGLCTLLGSTWTQLQRLGELTADSSVQSAKRRKVKDDSSGIRNKGTGYGGSAKSLNTTKFKEAQARQADQADRIADALTNITAHLHKLGFAASPSSSPAAAAAAGPAPVSADEDLPMVTVSSGSPINLQATWAGSLLLMSMLAASPLQDTFCELLRNTSSHDITQNQFRAYSALFELLPVLCSSPLLTPIVNAACPFRHALRAARRRHLRAPPTPAPAASPITVASVSSAKGRGRGRGRAAKKIEPAPLPSPAPAPAPTPAAAPATPQAGAESEDDEPSTSIAELMQNQDKLARVFVQQSRDQPDLEKEMQLCERMRKAFMALKHALQSLPATLRSVTAIDLSSDSAAPPVAAAAAAVDTATDEYLKTMRPLLFHMCDMDYERHVLFDQIVASDRTPVRAERMAHITREITSLATTLPLNLASSVFARVDENRPDVMKVLITGPADTPYHNGCFIFDVFLPPQYPAVPPQVRIITTDGGRVRFNPNLYRCGKVCLSLLGTWQGPGWEPNVSTLLQVLVSIQSLILVPDPFYNEPGFDQRAYKRESTLYNNALRYHTMNVAMLKALQTPAPEFRAVVRTHFTAKREEIRKQALAWLQQAREEETTAAQNFGCHLHELAVMPTATVEVLVTSLLAELDKLGPVDTITLD